MAVRPIDGDAVKRRAWDIAEAWKDQGRDYEALLLESVVEQIVDTAPTLTPPNEWVSVEERLPEEKQRVIVRCECVGTSVGWILWGNWMTDIGPGAGKVTHWMPLPEPPDRRPPEGENYDGEF